MSLFPFMVSHFFVFYLRNLFLSQGAKIFSYVSSSFSIWPFTFRSTINLETGFCSFDARWRSTLFFLFMGIKLTMHHYWISLLPVIFVLNQMTLSAVLMYDKVEHLFLFNIYLHSSSCELFLLCPIFIGLLVSLFFSFAWNSLSDWDISPLWYKLQRYVCVCVCIQFIIPRPFYLLQWKLCYLHVRVSVFSMSRRTLRMAFSSPPAVLGLSVTCGCALWGGLDKASEVCAWLSF